MRVSINFNIYLPYICLLTSICLAHTNENLRFDKVSDNSDIHIHCHTHFLHTYIHRRVYWTIKHTKKTPPSD